MSNNRSFMFYDAQCIRLRLLDGLVSVHASHLERCDINSLGNTRFTDNINLQQVIHQGSRDF